MSTYTYDESSGYYYDAVTTYYYDANSQYYFDSKSNAYLYWSAEHHAYLPAPTANASAAGADPSTNASGQQTSANKGEFKKDTAKSKSAQKIAKDMER